MGCGQSKNAIGAVPKTGDGNEPKEKPVEESTPASPAKKVPIERPRSKTIQVKTSANNSPASTPKLNRKVCYIIRHYHYSTTQFDVTCSMRFLWQSTILRPHEDVFIMDE